MKPITSILAAVAITALTSGAAIAKCHEATGSAKNETQQGISKDGTHAPMEDSASSQTQTGAASTGTTTRSEMKADKSTPLADQGGGVDKNLATSGQDVMAQQKGEKTAAAKGADATDCIE